MNTTNSTSSDDDDDSGLGSVQLTLVINAVAGAVFLLVFFLILRTTWALFSVHIRRKLFRKFVNDRKEKGSVIPAEEYPVNLDDELRDHSDAHDFLNDVDEKYIIPIPVLREIQVVLLFLIETILTLVWPSYQEEDKKRNVRFYGRDLAVYLSFQQKMIYCFAIILILAVAIIVPVHVTATPSEQYQALLNRRQESRIVDAKENEQRSNGAVLNNTLLTQPTDPTVIRTSFVMITNDPYRTLATVFMAAVFIVIVGFFFIVHFPRRELVSQFNYDGCDADFAVPEILIKQGNYGLRSHEERLHMAMRTSNCEESAILAGPYTLRINNLPTGFISVKLFTYMINLIVDKSQIANISLVMDVSKLYKLEQKLKKAQEKLERYETLQQNSKSEQPVQKNIYLKKGPIDGKRKVVFHVDGVQHYQNLIQKYKQKIAMWNHSYKRLHDDLEVSRYEVVTKGERVKENFMLRLDTPLQKDVDSTIPQKHYPIRCSGFAYIIFRSVYALKHFQREVKRMNLRLRIRERAVHDIDTATDRLYALVSISRSTNTISFKDAVEHTVTVDVPLQAQHIPTMPETDINTNIDKHLAGTKGVRPFLLMQEITYEPQDVHWKVMFNYKKTHTIPKRITRWLVTNILLLIIVIVFSTPYVFATFVSNIVQASAFGVQNTKFFLDPSDPRVQRLNQGTLYNFIFVYAPTLILFVSTMIIPLLIYPLTRISKLKTHSAYHRLISWRIYGFLLLATLIFPTLFFSYSVGFTELLLQVRNLGELLSAFALPSTGVFFINYVLQKAILKNCADLSNIGGVIAHLFTTWHKRFGKRKMSTRQRLFAAEKLDLRIEREYAYLVSIAGIALVYSVISPLVVAASMLYFLLKYAVDRYMLCYVYGHKKRLLGRRKNGQHLPMYGAIFGMKSDFVAHRKMMQLVTQMIIIAMMLSAAYLALIFGTKLADDRRFIFHFTASIFMVVVCVIAFLVHVGVTNWVLNRNVYMSEVKNAQPPSKDNISLGYEPPYPYIQMANQELEDKPEKEQLEEERVGTS